MTFPLCSFLELANGKLHFCVAPFVQLHIKCEATLAIS
jgi:hypothetical protein